MTTSDRAGNEGPRIVYTVEEAQALWQRGYDAALAAAPTQSGAEGPATLDRGEWARLRTVDDLARLIVSGWDSGFPVSDGSSESELIDRLRVYVEQPPVEPSRSGAEVAAAPGLDPLSWNAALDAAKRAVEPLTLRHAEGTAEYHISRRDAIDRIVGLRMSAARLTAKP